MAKKEVKEMVDCPMFIGHITIEECMRRGRVIECYDGMSFGKVVCNYSEEVDNDE